MTKDDLDLLKEFCSSIKLDLLNTRTFKKADGSFVVTVASIEVSKTTHNFKDAVFHVTYGEFAPYLKECNHALSEAKKYAANDTQVKMLEEYIRHF
jgi:dipeptidyl-peptidase III